MRMVPHSSPADYTRPESGYAIDHFMVNQGMSQLVSAPTQCHHDTRHMLGSSAGRTPSDHSPISLRISSNLRAAVIWVGFQIAVRKGGKLFRTSRFSFVPTRKRVNQKGQLVYGMPVSWSVLFTWVRMFLLYRFL